MPIQIVSSNLNQECDAGNFEADPSTWLVSTSIIISEFSYSRSTDQATKNLNSLKLVGNVFFAGGQNFRALNYALFTPQPNKKYVCFCNVRTPSSNQFASDNCSIHLEVVASGWSQISATPVLISECKDTWKQVVVMVDSGSSPAGSAFPRLMIYKTSGSGDDINSGGVLYVDQFEVYEYIDVAVVSDLDFTTTTTDDHFAADGSITVTATGGTSPYLYSLGGVAWQSSNVFTGLIGGNVYNIFVKDITGFVVNKMVAVNMASPTFSFITTVTNESVAGGNNGQIVVNVTGTVAPFQYSKDSGYTWQSSNVFANLAPGDYSVFVKDSTDFLIGAVVTVLPGQVAFEKIWWSRNPIIYAIAASPGWESLTNVRIYNDVTVDDDWNGIYVSKMKVDAPVDANGSVIFSNRPALEKTLVANPPDKTNPNPVKLQDRIKLFRNNTAQLSGTETTPSSTTPSLPHLVLLGGLSKYQWAKLEKSTPFFTSYLPSKNIFMTWAPKVKPVDKNQEDYLNYFVAISNVATLKRNLKIYYDDGTNEIKVDVLINGSAHYGDLYELRAGPMGSGAMGYAQAAGKNLIKYEYSLLNQYDTAISETRTYVLDAVSHPRKRLFMFLNSLGSYEVLRFTGAAERQAIITKNEIVKFLPYSYNSLDGEREMNDVTLRESDNFSSGYFNDQYGKDWLDYMKDLLVSRRVFDVTDGNRVPVMIQPATYPMGADQNYEYYVRFVGADAYEDENYTPKILP